MLMSMMMHVEITSSEQSYSYRTFGCKIIESLFLECADKSSVAAGNNSFVHIYLRISGYQNWGNPKSEDLRRNFRVRPLFDHTSTHAEFAERLLIAYPSLKPHLSGLVVSW
jgi:hypothetical protein